MIYSIKHVRKSKGITQEQIAITLGMVVQSYRRYENGHTPITLDLLERIAEALGVSMLDLLAHETNINQQLNYYFNQLDAHDQDYFFTQIKAKAQQRC